MKSENQLETWSHIGAIQSSALTFASIKNSLSSKFAGSTEIYLQGSYKNSTNIRGDSDVDIVVEYNNSFSYDLDYLNDNEKIKFHQKFQKSQYLWDDFRSDVLSTLQAHYGYSKVEPGDKSIKVIGFDGRLNGDVIVCFSYRKYFEISDSGNDLFLSGIVFWSQKTIERIINYPNLHYSNGVKKNDDINTKGMYKPLVRVFKNARTNAYNQGIIPLHTPSYFLECLLYNVPNENFKSTYQSSVIYICSALLDMKLEDCKCQNGITPLFGTKSTQWNITDANSLILGLVNFLLKE